VAVIPGAAAGLRRAEVAAIVARIGVRIVDRIVDRIGVAIVDRIAEATVVRIAEATVVRIAEATAAVTAAAAETEGAMAGTGDRAARSACESRRAASVVAKSFFLVNCIKDCRTAVSPK
jgi:hypothetical protein